MWQISSIHERWTKIRANLHKKLANVEGNTTYVDKETGLEFGEEDVGRLTALAKYLEKPYYGG